MKKVKEEDKAKLRKLNKKLNEALNDDEAPPELMRLLSFNALNSVPKKKRKKRKATKNKVASDMLNDWLK